MYSFLQSTHLFCLPLCVFFNHSVFQYYVAQTGITLSPCEEIQEKLCVRHLGLDYQGMDKGHTKGH